MPTIALPLDHRRAMVEVEVSVTAHHARALQQAGKAVPAPLHLDALIDTGASRTCLDEAVRRSLNLRAFGTQSLSTPAPIPAGPKVFRLYKINLAVIHPSGNPNQDLTRAAFTVAAIHLAHLGTDLVIGRDLLASCRLLYDGRAGTFELDY